MARSVAILILAVASGCASMPWPCPPDPSILQPPACGEGVPAPTPMAPGVAHPVYLAGPAPQYTRTALSCGVEGRLVVQCVITAEGVVKDCCVREGLPHMNAAVIDALERRRYRPAMKDGKPVEVWYTFTLHLRLPS